MRAVSPRAGLFALAAAVFALAACQVSRSGCDGCHIEEVRLVTPDDTRFQARLFIPHPAAARVPAVVVCHGYLANLAFMEVPWAEDLVHLGVAALFLDRRGHGQSGGSLWPRAVTANDRPAADDEIAAALVFLRAHAEIDGARLAILGHSDGGSAAILAGTSDWDLRATVAVSASVAAWEQVSYAAPRNLLLAYGAADRFVLHDTDAQLIAGATRGYLDGPGAVGRLDDGSARRLLRVPGRGHVDVIFSPRARTTVLDWLRGALGAPGSVGLSGTRRAWRLLGAGALLGLVATAPRWRSRAGAHEQPRRFPWARLFAIAGGGVVAMLTAARLVRHLGLVPGQATDVIAALLGGGGAVMTAAAVIQRGVARARGRAERPQRSPQPPCAASDSRRGLALDAAWGAVLALAALAGLQVLLHHLYDVPLTAQRGALMAIAGVLALPCFAGLESCLAWASRGAPAWVKGGTLALLAAIVAGGAPLLFERMAVLPAYVFAAVLLMSACHRLGAPMTPPATGAVMATLLLARLTASVSALY